MLFHKERHGAVEIMDMGRRLLVGTLSLEMDDRHGTEVIITIPGFVQAETQINILAIHEIVRIKSAGFIQHIAPGHEESA